MNLEKRFGELINRNVYWLTADELFGEINKKYSEDHRYYHKLNHIQGCLREFDEIKYLLIKPDEVEMAIFYHDVIYDVKRKDNEEESAKFAKEKLGNLGFPRNFVERVYDLILDTVEHNLGKLTDSRYMVDIDLSPLGASWKEFVLNRENISKEDLTKYSEKEFKMRTLNFYKKMLNRKRIFHTDYFYNKYEIKARKNIQKGINMLSI
jgi:predicted metal-dependent HD superfamily phosphohydrolase